MNPIGKHSRSKTGFAGLYLERYGSGTVGGLPEPDPDLFLIVTIPAYKEQDLAASLRSLLDCDPPGVKWEIIVNINYPENSPSDVIRISRQSRDAVENLSSTLERSDVRIHCLWNPDLPYRHAGVGLARKQAMDQSVQRFNTVGRPEGVILSFDADSACDSGYLNSIVSFYQRTRSARAANIYFEHPLSGGFEPRIYRSISQYELYLRYMRLAIEATGHPHPIHTVGSSFSVRCRTYIRVNGMGRDKAGEDFYFLHKCIQLKRFWEINDTMVRPSVRESDRVSFGTGASVHRQMQTEASLEVYCLDSFQPLKELFGRVDVYWHQISGFNNLRKERIAAEEPSASETDNRQPATGTSTSLNDSTLSELEVQWKAEWEVISTGLAVFLDSQNAITRIREFTTGSASGETFRDKFFAWFNGFMILRYLNEMHKSHYLRMPVMHEASRLALILGISTAESAEKLLANFRDFERGRGNRRII